MPNAPADASYTTSGDTIRVIPETTKKALYVNCNSMPRFGGSSETASAALIDFLCVHVGRPDFTSRFRWRTGFMVVWDNRCTQHFAIDDYGTVIRGMRRARVLGERSLGPAGAAASAQGA